jgi:hypothetical protein
MGMYDTVNYKADCDNCGSWHDFKVNRVCIVNSIDVDALPSKVSS